MGEAKRRLNGESTRVSMMSGPMGFVLTDGAIRNSMTMRRPDGSVDMAMVHQAFNAANVSALLWPDERRRLGFHILAIKAPRDGEEIKDIRPFSFFARNEREGVQIGRLLGVVSHG